MPANFNKVVIAGNLTRDPELRYTPKGTAQCNVCVAINRHWKDESGTEKEEVTFVDCDAWGRTAENISQYLKKGRSVLIEGRLKLNQWEDRQTNQKRQQLKVVIETVTFLGSADGGEQGQEKQQAREFNRPAFNKPPGRPAPVTAPADGSSQEEEDDVPF